MVELVKVMAWHGAGGHEGGGWRWRRPWLGSKVFVCQFIFNFSLMYICIQCLLSEEMIHQNGSNGK